MRTLRPDLLCFCAAVLFTAGCAGYHLGPASGEKAGTRSVQIAPFANHTLEPRLPEYVMMSLRKRLMQDGTYLLNTHDDGDVIVTGEIKDYQRIGLSYQPTDVQTVQNYEITMTAQITAKERGTGKVIFDKTVMGHTSLQVGTDLTSAERQAIPLLADDLAKKTTALLVDGTW